MTYIISAIGDGESVDVGFREEMDLPVGYNLVKNASLVDFQGIITRQGDLFVLNGTVDTRILFMCDRCLAPVSVDMNFEILEKYTLKLPEDEETEVVIYRPEGVVDCAFLR